MMLDDKIFDLVIVEDSHYLDDLDNSILQAIARHANKIVLLGELMEYNNIFSKLFHNLLPAYRIELSENYRLHPNLARKIFPALYPLQPTPYTPLQQRHTPLPQGSYRLNWLDVKNIEQIQQSLEQSLENSFYQQPYILTFSSELFESLQQQFPHLSNSIIRSVKDWIGRECEALWIIYDKSDQLQPNLTDICLALTRASDVITIVGDWEYYQNSFNSLFSAFHFVRDIVVMDN